MTWERRRADDRTHLLAASSSEVFGAAREPRTELTEHHDDVAARCRPCSRRLLRVVREVHRRTGADEPLPRRRRRAQLRRQRHDPRRDRRSRTSTSSPPRRRGTAIGAALLRLAPGPRPPARLRDGARVHGPRVLGRRDSRRALEAARASSRTRLDDDELFDRPSPARIAAGEVVGWFQGRMEFGPRALGNRSILADPRRDDMKDILNARIKHREPFRPFAPSILAEAHRRVLRAGLPLAVHGAGLQDAGRRSASRSRPSPTSTAPVGCRPSSAHVNPRYYRLIEEFEPAHRRADPAQHLVQRERADRDDAGAGARHLPEDAHGCSGPRQPRGAPHVNRRPRLLVLNQYYEPGVEATGRLLAQTVQRPRRRVRCDRDYRHAAECIARPRGP